MDSHANWWAEAGFLTPVGDAPCDWLARDTPALPDPESAPAERLAPAPLRRAEAPPAPILAEPALAPLTMPDGWDAFQQWLAHDPAVPGTRWHPQRIVPHGAVGARLVVLSLCPEMEDQDAGALHSGAVGRLVDAMLRAIGLQRADCYMAALAMTRPPGGRIDEPHRAALAPLLWHHLRLARPGRLLLLGSDVTQMVLGTDLAALRGQLRIVNHDGVKVEAVAIQHPMLLLDRPARKAMAWESLKLLAQG